MYLHILKRQMIYSVLTTVSICVSVITYNELKFMFYGFLRIFRWPTWFL